MGVPGEGAFLRTRGRVLLKRGVHSFEIQISDGGSFRALCSSASNNLNKTTCDAGGASASSMRIRMKEAFGARGGVAAQRRVRIRSRIPFGVLPTGGLRNAAMFYVGGDVALLAAGWKRRLVARARAGAAGTVSKPSASWALLALKWLRRLRVSAAGVSATFAFWQDCGEAASSADARDKFFTRERVQRNFRSL